MRGHGRLAHATLGLVACVSIAFGSAATSPTPTSSPDLDATYRQLLATYRGGDAETAVRSVAGWDRARLSALRSTSVFAFKSSFGDLGQQAQLVETAAALHTRAAVRRTEALTGGAPRDHLDLARSLVERLATNRASAAFVRAWYVALSTYLAGAINPSAFLGHAANVSRLYGSDPDALVPLAIGYERVADSPFKPSSKPSVFASPEPGRREDVDAPLPGQMERRRWLDLAVSSYRSALARDPANAAIRLRLGRALVMSGQPRAAVADLEQVEQAPARVQDRFLAALYLGLALDRSGRDTAARAAYRRAWMLLPGARSGAFALSEIEQRLGNLREASAIIEQFTDLQPAPRLDEDPWWILENDWRPRVERALDALDEALRR